MADQAETLRTLMSTRMAERASAEAGVVSVFLAPEARRNRRFSPRELALLNRAQRGGYRIRDESDALAITGGEAPLLGALLVLSDDEVDVVATYQEIKRRARSGTVKKLDIIVCGVNSESEGQRVFSRLFEVASRFLEVELVYRGAFGIGEKMRDNLAIRKFLLHYQSRTRECPNQAGSQCGR